NGVKFIGVGYNLLKGNPDGGSDQEGGVDPGLLVLRKIFQLSSGDKPKEIVFEDRYSCLKIRSTHVFYGAKSYQDKLGVGVDTSVCSDYTNLRSIAGYSHAKTETNEQRKVFYDDVNICNLGRVRFAEELADSDGFSVTRNFASAICHLPHVYDKQKYMTFLDNWGTHATMEVEMGNRTINRYRASLAEFIKHVQKSGGFGFHIGGSYMGASGSLGVDFSKFKQTDQSSLKFGQYEYTLHSGREDKPEPIHLKLKTIVSALDPIYWTSHEIRSACPSAETRIASTKQNMLQALNEYAAYKMAPTSENPELRMPITWPVGSYGLMKTTSGCPSGRVHWSEGWRYQDTENIINKNSWSNPIHLSGDKSDFKFEFCMKGNTRISDFDVEWPSGDYCILKYGGCPSSQFKSGWIYWDDENFRNKDKYGGSLPDGQFSRDTKIEFCCRDDGLPSKEILLPTEKPFIMLKYTRECQHVHGMTVREEYVRWDDQDVINHDKEGGAHPYDDGGRHNHRLHFCYYSPSKHLIG
ncbi:hypothetical protein LOTGIDRAFT_137430, partial [Lottia gigantea]